LLWILPATSSAARTLPLITYRLLRSSAGEKSLGLVYAVNTLGAIVGVALAVHLLLTTLGVRGALLVGGAVDVALGVFLLLAWRKRGGGWRTIPWPAAADVVGLAFLAIA